MKRVLIITYYWPPAGGPGVQRWLKYSKYLPGFGWQPVIYTPENPELPARDESLEAEIHPGTEVIRRRIIEPYSVYKWITGRKEPVNVGFTRTEADLPESRLEKTMRWVRGNFFIPDARRFWIRPSVSFLLKKLHKNPVDAIITTGPPHSLHLIGRKLSKRTGIPWLADFRDPWTGIDFYDDLLLTAPADRRHRNLERSVLKSADVVTTVSDQIRAELTEKGSRRTEVIPNGFDPADFDGVKPAEREPETFQLVHTGSLVPSRNPEALWKTLGKICKDDAEFRSKLRIRLAGSTDVSVRKSIEKHGLGGITEFLPYMPHSEAIRQVLAADVLMLLINRTANAEGFLSGKVFEYLASVRPILCVGPAKGDAARLLKETASGETFDYDDATGMEDFIRSQFSKAKSVNFRFGADSPSTSSADAYSRKTQAGRIAEILESIS